MNVVASGNDFLSFSPIIGCNFLLLFCILDEVRSPGISSFIPIQCSGYAGMYLNYIYLYISKAEPDERLEQRGRPAADFEPIKVFKKFYGAELEKRTLKKVKTTLHHFVPISCLETVISRQKHIQTRLVCFDHRLKYSFSTRTIILVW